MPIEIRGGQAVLTETAVTAVSWLEDVKQAEAAAFDFSRPHKPHQKTKQGDRSLRFVVMGSAVALLVGVLGVLAFLMKPWQASPSKDSHVVASAPKDERSAGKAEIKQSPTVESASPDSKQAPTVESSPPARKEPSATIPDRKQPPTLESAPPARKEPNQEQPPQETVPTAPSEMDGTRLFQRLLRSSVVIFGESENGYGVGSGALIDAEKRLVLTNDHVVRGKIKVRVSFPVYENGVLIREFPRFLTKVAGQDTEPAFLDWIRHSNDRVVLANSEKDLALIQIDAIPPGVIPLPLASESIKDGQPVLSMGNAAVIDYFDTKRVRPLWLLTQGSVRAVYQEEWRSQAGFHRAKVVETQSPINAGDSGGPLVDRRGRLVAVTQARDRSIRLSQGKIDTSGGNLRSYFVDVSEVHGILESYHRQIGQVYVRRPPSETVLDPEVNIGKLINDLSHADQKVRSKAAQTLGEVGADAKAAVPALLAAVNRSDDMVLQKLASEALWRIGPPSESEVPALIGAIEAGNEPSCRYALDAIQKTGPKARAAVPALIGLMRKQEKPVDLRLAAIHAIASLELAANDAIPALLETLKDPSIEIRMACIQALGNAGPVGKSAVPALIGLLSDSDRSVRTGAIMALVQTELAPDQASEALSGVTQALADPQLKVRAAACTLLKRMGGLASPAAEKLAGLLDDKERSLHTMALDALAAIGPGAEPAVPRLLIALEDPELQPLAVKTLSKIGESAVFPLVRCLMDRRPGIRVAAIDALAEMGPQAKAAIPALELRMRSDVRLEVRARAAQAIRRIRE